MTSASFHHHRMAVALAPGSDTPAPGLLDAVALTLEDGSQGIRLFFDRGITQEDIGLPEGVSVTQTTPIGDYLGLTCTRDRGEDGGEDGANAGTTPPFAMPPFAITLAGRDVEVTPCAAEDTHFAGRNVIIAERNGEPADTVLDWLIYHARHHALGGAVILDRAQPDTDPAFAKDLSDMAAETGLDLSVVILQANHALGRPDMPPEAHPFCVAESPGKDRMEIPPPDPWRSPLAALCVYEIVRARFCARARAVANIDVHDLLDLNEPNVFDHVQEAENGVLPLIGRHVFPWRVRPDAAPHFGDHICVQFDARKYHRRWCVAPARLPQTAVWRLIRVANAAPAAHIQGHFHRCMNLRHRVESVSLIVPKTSLVEDPGMLALARDVFAHKPIRVPPAEPVSLSTRNGRRAIVTTMKNEGPFILEWLAYHRAIGFDDFLVYTNDCTDGTDKMFDLLQEKGLLQHRENPFRSMGLKPQHAALQAAEDEPIIADAAWVTCIDVDEFINIKTGDGTLDALFAAVPDANMIAMTWRLFGNADIHAYHDGFITAQFTRCAREFANKPHQAWGFKTMFQNIGIFKKLGVHRPKGLNPQLWEKINWVNGSGQALPHEMFRNAWRSDSDTYGYDLVQLNHYAVRTAESFLVKRDRGRVNHVDRDQGMAYWFRMNNNGDEDRSILSRLAPARAEFDRLMTDPQIRAQHKACVASHHDKIAALKTTDAYARFYSELTAPRLEKLARMHHHFGANVFLQGPGIIPDDIVARDPDEDFFFTVELGETQH